MNNMNAASDIPALDIRAGGAASDGETGVQKNTINRTVCLSELRQEWGSDGGRTARLGAES